jgi:hypothetical protein
VCKRSPLEGEGSHLWVLALRFILRHDPNLLGEDGFNTYHILVKGVSHGSSDPGCEIDHSDLASDTWAYVGQIEMHSAFVPSTTNTTSSPETECATSSVVVELILTDLLNVDVLLVCRDYRLRPRRA